MKTNKEALNLLKREKEKQKPLHCSIRINLLAPKRKQNPPKPRTPRR